MLARGACLVSTDISDQMLTLFAEKIRDDQDFHAIPGNKADVKVEDFPGAFDLEGYLAQGYTGTDRVVVGRLANNECLPFKAESFDCYLACLSLMLVDNHINMLEEAFRVCQSGASLGFTVWGRKENLQMFEALDTVVSKHGLKPPTPPKKTSYDLGKDPEGLKA